MAATRKRRQKKATDVIGIDTKNIVGDPTVEQVAAQIAKAHPVWGQCYLAFHTTGSMAMGAALVKMNPREFGRNLRKALSVAGQAFSLISGIYV